MKIQILVDNPNSWIIPYAKKLIMELKHEGYNVLFLANHSDVESGELLFLLSCEKIFKNLKLNRHNLVVHESELPKGKGWSPVTWQVLEGRKDIPVTLFEATDKVDAGTIYLQDFFKLKGDELLPEIKHLQGNTTNKLIKEFITNYPNIKGEEQQGQETFYRKRGPEDSQLDINKTIAEQFNLFRVCDNERYPAFFELNGVKYNLKIEKNV